MSLPQGTLRLGIQQSSYALLIIGEEHATFTIASWAQSAHECSSLSVLAICCGGLWSELRRPQRERESLSFGLEGKKLPPQT